MRISLRGISMYKPQLVGFWVYQPRQFRAFFHIDGSWKENKSFSGLGWYCVRGDGLESLVGARNLRRSLSSLHAELEALIWAMHSLLANQRTDVAFVTDSTKLVKMVSSPMQ